MFEFMISGKKIVKKYSNLKIILPNILLGKLLIRRKPKNYIKVAI